MMINELEALSILAATPLLGSIKIRLLIQYFGSACETLQASSQNLHSIPGLSSKTLLNWRWWEKDCSWTQNLELTDKENVQLLPYTSPDYPKSLRELPDFPVLLYVKGSLLKTDNRSLAVVGTRQASIYGLEMAEKISSDLVSQGFTVVSGLARGIDTAAHKGALKRGRTIAVIGSGLANIYPRENHDLAELIAEQGAVISEFPMKTPPDRQNFPQRNRIVSGMTLGSVLIEAPEKSGAIITMNKAKEQGKKLFAIPGRIDYPSFQGNHSLIKKGEAQLVESASDITAAFEDLFGLSQPTPLKPNLFSSLEKEEEMLCNQLPDHELSIEDIVRLTKLPVMKINILLMSLVLKKVVKEYPGKIYKKDVY